jgi:hypothetical protein
MIDWELYFSYIHDRTRLRTINAAGKYVALVYGWVLLSPERKVDSMDRVENFALYRIIYDH